MFESISTSINAKTENIICAAVSVLITPVGKELGSLDCSLLIVTVDGGVGVGSGCAGGSCFSSAGAAASLPLRCGRERLRFGFSFAA